jgi:hypothetical protein
MTPIPSKFGSFDIADFTVGSMLRAGLALRVLLRDVRSLEDGADAVVHYFREHFRDPATGERDFALARFYTTRALGSLSPELQLVARDAAGGADAAETAQCLVLGATTGDRPEWNDPARSVSHRAILLSSVDVVRNAPMIARLFDQFGVDVDAIVRGDVPDEPREKARTYDVFHVERALDSPYIPAQREFVQPYRIASVLGFGGFLRNGHLFAVILFSTRTIPAESAARFRSIALDVRSALFDVSIPG